MIGNTEAEIWGRLIEPEKADLSADAARSFLALTFKKTDRDRMNYLAAQARAGRLSDPEKVELQEYLRAGDLLALLKSKARQSLRRTTAPGGRKSPRQSAGRRDTSRIANGKGRT